MLKFLYICLIGDLVLSQTRLISTNDNFMSVFSGFTVRLQCSVYRCEEEQPSVVWYKDDLLIFNGTDFQASSGIEPANVLLQLTTTPQQNRDSCSTDEYTLLLRNLTQKDAGKYRCQLHRKLQQLDFQVDVLENGMKNGFHRKLKYDIVDCCVEQGISPSCKSMCKPKEMDLEFFDPTSCKTKDYKNFLYCATDNGKHDFVPCCRKNAVPSFCFDFCSFRFSILKRSHRLCLYYLPEILECFSQKQAQPPNSPKGLQIRRAQHKLLCWRQESENDSDSKIEYSVHIREIPLLSIPSEEGNGRRHSVSESRRPLHNRRIGRSVQTKPSIIVAQNFADRGQTEFIRLEEDQIEQTNEEICISLAGLRKGTRYVFYAQSSNDNGISQPSAALFAVI